jgi:hypothetical protein
MALRLAAAGLLLAAGLWLRFGPRLDERRATVVALGLAVGAAVAAGLGMVGRGLDLVDAYTLAGVGALAVSGRDRSVRPAMGLALAVYGLALLAALWGGAAPVAEHLSLGPALLALTIAAAGGALAALAVGRVVRAGVPLMLLLALGLVLLFCVHRPNEVDSSWWGVLGGLRSGDEAVFVFGPAVSGQLGLPLMVSRGTAGLLGLSGVAAVLVTAAFPRLRRWLVGAAAVLVVAAVAVLLSEGLGAPLGEETRAAVEHWSATGLLHPVGGEEPVRLDLVTLLPALAAFALAAGLLEGAALSRDAEGFGREEAEEAVASDLDVAIAVGALLLAALIGVWREVWGSGLGEGVGPLLAVAAAVTLGLRLGVGSGGGGALGAVVLLLIGASQLPAGALPGLS